MAKGQHPLEEITVAIDLVVLLNAIEVEATNGFFCHAEVTPFRKTFREVNKSGKDRIKMIKNPTYGLDINECVDKVSD